MSALILQNNALWHIFEDFTASILLSTCFLIYIIRNQFSNHPPTHDNKIANELSTHMTEINCVLTAEIEKNKTRDGSITAEIERLLTNVYKNLALKLTLKSPTNIPHVFLKLILLSLRSLAKIIINLPQKSKRSIHVMLDMPLRRRKFYRWSIT